MIPWWSVEIGDEEKNALTRAFNNNNFTCGAITKEFEESLSKKLNVPYVVVVNSGTSALVASLLAAGVGPGDEVIVPALTWVATAQAVDVTGAKAVIVDCQEHTTTIDVEKIQARITKRTKVIIPVHLNAKACDMKRIIDLARTNHLTVIEDTCKAIFSSEPEGYLGTIGDMGCFSMGMISLLNVGGYGGFIATKSTKHYNDLLLIRDHGVKRSPEEYGYRGLNLKISDLQSAIGLSILKKIDSRISASQAIYKKYLDKLCNVKGIKILKIDVNNQKIPIYSECYCENRDSLCSYLEQNKIQTSKFHLPISEAKYLNNSGFYPNANNFSQHCCILPSGPSQLNESIEKCISEILNWSSKYYN